MCELLPGAKVTCLYVVDLPIDDYYSRSLQNVGYKAVLMDAAKKAFDKFIEDHGFDLSLIEPVFYRKLFPKYRSTHS